jgi:hypothetical protein
MIIVTPVTATHVLAQITLSSYKLAFARLVGMGISASEHSDEQVLIPPFFNIISNLFPYLGSDVPPGQQLRG